MHRRDGSTLMEVLIAIFVMGIGLLSILALFPMGAMTMARAIKDDRAGHASANAKAIAIAQNIRFDSNVTLFFDPGNNAPLDGPSWPVFADPIGYNSYSIGADQSVVGSTTNIRRCSLSFVPNSTAALLKWCTLLDDITFGPNGGPSLDSGTIDRATSVSWAWMLRRPKMGTPSCVEMTVVIYNQRPITTAVRLGAKEVAYANCPVNPQQPNLVTLTWAANQLPPRIVEGGWVLDATPNGNLPCNATFYRVNSVGDFAGNTLPIELSQPLRGFPRAGNTPATIVIMDGVVEVQECGSGWSSWSN